MNNKQMCISTITPTRTHKHSHKKALSSDTYFLSSGKELLWVVIVGWMVGRSVCGSMWQYDDWSMGFMCWSLIGQNKFTLQTSVDARVAPGIFTVQYKQLIISVHRLE